MRSRRRLLFPTRLGELWLTARAFWFLAVVDRQLSGDRAPQVIARALAGASRAPVDEDALCRGSMYAACIARASRHHVVRAQCLHQSLVLHAWLHRDGLPAELRIGVRKVDDALVAHAWVEMGGHVLNDHPDRLAVFTPLGMGGGRSADCRHPRSSQLPQRQRPSEVLLTPETLKSCGSSSL